MSPVGKNGPCTLVNVTVETSIPPPIDSLIVWPNPCTVSIERDLCESLPACDRDVVSCYCMKLGWRETAQRTSRTIQAVQRGEEIFLAGRGRPVAAVQPIAAVLDSEAAALRKMVDAGLVVAAAEPGLMPAPRWRLVAVKGKPLSKTVVEDRDERA